jgi:hypothetical protein
MPLRPYLDRHFPYDRPIRRSGGQRHRVPRRFQLMGPEPSFDFWFKDRRNVLQTRFQSEEFKPKQTPTKVARAEGRGNSTTEASMLKAAIVACAICAGVGGTAFWVKSGGSAAVNPSVAAGSLMPSIQELHANAHLENLPVQVVADPF